MGKILSSYRDDKKGGRGERGRAAGTRAVCSTRRREGERGLVRVLVVQGKTRDERWR